MRFLPALLSLSCVAAYAAPQLTYRFALATGHPTVGEPVFVRFSVQSGQPEPVTVEVASNSHGYGSFRAQLTRPDGTSEKAPKDSVHELVARETLTLGPFQTASTTILVNKWFDFRAPGRYVLDLVYVNDAAGRGSGIVTIDITARDPGKLRSLCADFSAKLMWAQTADAAFLAAEALSHINDPIAVPFLASLLGVRRGVEPELIAGLERIGDSAAVSALLAHRNDGTEDTRDMVNAALRRLAVQKGGRRILAPF